MSTEPHILHTQPPFSNSGYGPEINIINFYVSMLSVKYSSLVPSQIFSVVRIVTKLNYKTVSMGLNE